MAEPSLVKKLVTIHISMITLAVITVVSRLLVRLGLTDGGLGRDDLVIVVSLVDAVAYVFVSLEQIKYGSGQHRADLPKTTDFTKAQELFHINQVLYFIAVGTTKIAVLILYLRIVPSNRRLYRYTIFGIMAFVVLTVVACSFVAIFQCTRMSPTWNNPQDGHCIDQIAFHYSNAGLDIFQDLIIYILPLRILYQLQLPRNDKIALCAIFIVSGFVCITGMLRLGSLKTALATNDPTWYNVDADNWSIVEICVGILCAFLSQFRPLFSRLLSGFRMGSDRATSGGTSSGNMHGITTRTSTPRLRYIRTIDPSHDIELLSMPAAPGCDLKPPGVGPDIREKKITRLG